MGLMKILRHLHEARDRLVGSLRESLRDPVGERLDFERRQDVAMFRRHRAFVPWAP